MRSNLTIVRAYCIRPILAAILVLAMALTLSCSEDKDDGNRFCVASRFANEKIDMLRKKITRACAINYPDLIDICASKWEEKAKEYESIRLFYDVASGSKCVNLEGTPELVRFVNEVEEITDDYWGFIMYCKEYPGREGCPEMPIPPPPPSSSSPPPSSSSGGDIGPCTGDPVTIGTQVWQKCNLNVVPSTGNSACYGNDPANCAKYGRLYDWAAAMTACPSGWHLPSEDEWDALMTAVGGSSIAGRNLKATSGWNSNGNGTDYYGFAALPGGFGSSFDGVGYHGSWWSASERGAYQAYSRDMYYDDESAYWYYNGKGVLLSVRCLQD